MKNNTMFKYIYFLSISFFVLGFVDGCKKDKNDESQVAENVFFVNCDAGGSVRNGKSWNTAFHTIQEAIDADVSGEDSRVTSHQEIWIAKGTYYENLLIHSGILLFGGFQGNENSKDQRDWVKNLTIIDGSGSGPVIKASSIIISKTRIDGFIIQHGYPNDDGDGGGIIVNIDNLGYFTIENNTIQQNTSYGFGGIYLGGESLVHNNTIKDNSSLITGSKDGSGICCYNCSPVISNNIFSGNNSTNGSALDGYEFRGRFINNVITGGKGSLVYVGYSSGLFANNLIVNNPAAERIFVIYYSNTKAYNNSISSNPNACAFELISNLSPQIVNNIISDNKSGIRNEDDEDYYSVIIKNNCLFGNTNGNYEDILPGIDNITDDPKLSSDFHLQSGSPCINSGDNSVVLESWIDMDGENRINADQVDIGADEFY